MQIKTNQIILFIFQNEKDLKYNDLSAVKGGEGHDTHPLLMGYKTDRTFLESNIIM